MKVIQHTVPPGTPPERIDRYLAKVVRDFSRAQIQRWLTQGLIRANDQVVKPSHRVGAGERLLIQIPPPIEFQVQPESIPLSIVFGDQHLIVVDKPAGMVTHPAPGHLSGTLVNALVGQGIPLSSVGSPLRPGIVHRLDKDTSGLLVVAKDTSVHRALARQFAEGQVRRVYLAVVKGRMASDTGTIQVPLGRHPVKRQRIAVRYNASREAVTRYRVIQRLNQATFLELTPQTGRTHQLRVHLSYLGHPILGDTQYGIKGGFPRQALHAHRLGFEHPVTRVWMEFASPLPPDLQTALKKLGG